MICLPLPYVKKFIERAGMTPTRVGTRPLNNARGVSSLAISLTFYGVVRDAYTYMRNSAKGREENMNGTQLDDMYSLDKVP